MTGEVIGETGQPTSEARRILELTDRVDWPGALAGVDGSFAAVVYDGHNRIVHLITNRYGHEPLYWTRHQGRLYWASEAKAMLGIPEFDPRIDSLSAESFLQTGMLLGDRTWFEGVSLVPPGSVLSFDLNRQEIRIRRYWHWNDIPARATSLPIRHAARELGDHFLASVRRRAPESDRVGLMLSGGLDSRAILGAISASGRRVPVVTYGQADAPDVQFARRAADARSASHHVFELGEGDWLSPRLPLVWRTDGEVSLLHMHLQVALHQLPDLYAVEMQGFAGDLLLGGSYLRHPRYFKPAGRMVEIASEVLRCDRELLERLGVSLDYSRTDFFFLDNWVRRFTLGGIRLIRSVIDARFPFFDNNLLDFVYSVPDVTRYGGALYRHMLLDRFPDLYVDIPYASTGRAIHRPARAPFTYAVTRAGAVYDRIRRGLARRFGPGTPKQSRHYHDYPAWIRKSPAAEAIRSSLLDRNALYPEFVDRAVVASQLDRHMRGENYAPFLLRAFTMEVWLQQVRGSAHRPEPASKPGWRPDSSE
jgi:asparagine synthase (glutamine-hydrolysing)